MTLTSIRVRSCAASTLSIVIWHRPFHIGLDVSETGKTWVGQSMITSSLPLRCRYGPCLFDHDAGRARQLIDHPLQTRPRKVIDAEPELSRIGNKRRVLDHLGDRAAEHFGSIHRRARPGYDRPSDVG